MDQGPGRLPGKSAVITGAAFGIGRATAVSFAREGARMVVTDIQGEALLAFADELRETGAEVETVIGDVSVEDDARRMIAAATARFGRLDVLVANAGIIPLGDVQEMTTADWDGVMAIDGRGMFLTCKFGIEAMLPTGGGAIVCLTSISGVAGQKRQAAYGPAKFVATGLAKHLAVEWADRGIRVNAVAPGTISTERVNQMREEPGGPEYLATVEAMHPMGRIGEPAEVASAILFLASDDASFITGAVLPVDGGYLAQ
ncbi:SDR family NAD(P)-dependent oxidoreductase [Mycolicibacterium diernhoferi]|uniref:NAD(P)-dependent oxidoreductase n=1 Tax=Mycolicibacterium diernhoferi TaxID=1801 RepID=A0A1Q4H902_9MYCO|nr:SDR family NAD(P)-dependent oxidoreductase [Mycolicibacterium diernhoferi]OJZ64024.1 short-chain dehydrogenase [Mycolicibacterium diernhoferi]OPE52875.1 short-chain dehydrogenase [Mycolicibacterium diernhoferi]PEG55592.1 NAD(P)-dependent oxidoreductase [Mycolicibacterium diernhoferi]QYL20709.1 SDR family oxidoreductase [Mycolicibacterium diernhoferi]